MYQGQGFEEQNVTWLVILQKLWETLKPKKWQKQTNFKKNKVDATLTHIWYYICDDVYTSDYNII